MSTTPLHEQPPAAPDRTTAPRRWKMWVLLTCAIHPLILIIATLTDPFVRALPPAARFLVVGAAHDRVGGLGRAAAAPALIRPLVEPVTDRLHAVTRMARTGLVRAPPRPYGRTHARGLGERVRTAAVALVVVLGVLAGAAGCGLLGGSGPEPAAEGAPPRLRVSIMPTTDLAPFHLAVRDGLFQAEGVRVEAVPAPSGQASLAKLIGGEVDIAYSSYTPFFVAQSQGAADLRFVADASSAAPNTTMVVAMPGSAVRSAADLAGKRIAVTATNTISDTLVKSAMREAGADFTGVQWVSIPFPETAPALARGDVDAAFLTEPFITLAARSVGAVPIVDTATGPAADLPTAGYAALAGFADESRDAIAAFQRAMAKATTAAADRREVEPLLVEHTGIDAETASATALLNFRSALDARQLQRVPDLLLEFGVLQERVDAAAMIGPAP